MMKNENSFYSASERNNLCVINIVAFKKIIFYRIILFFTDRNIPKITSACIQGNRIYMGETGKAWIDDLHCCI